MDKPKVFVNNINKEINNNKEEYYYKGEVFDVNVKEKINELFLRNDFVYKNKVSITLKNNNNYVVDVVALKNNELITLDGNKINIDDIKNIKKAN